jgi:hypothetical protein
MVQACWEKNIAEIAKFLPETVDILFDGQVELSSLPILSNKLFG